MPHCTFLTWLVTLTGCGKGQHCHSPRARAVRGTATRAITFAIDTPRRECITSERGSEENSAGWKSAAGDLLNALPVSRLSFRADVFPGAPTGRALVRDRLDSVFDREVDYSRATLARRTYRISPLVIRLIWRCAHARNACCRDCSVLVGL